MTSLFHFVISSVIILFTSRSVAQSIGGCSAEDILMVNNVVNEWIDIIDISLNQGILTSELIDYFEVNMAESFKQTVVNEDAGGLTTVIEGRDVYMYGLLGYTYFGNLNTHYTTPYTKCTTDALSGEETAIHTLRAVEHYIEGQVQPDGSTINIELLLRIVYTMKKVSDSWIIAEEYVSFKAYDTFVNPGPTSTPTTGSPTPAPVDSDDSSDDDDLSDLEEIFDEIQAADDIGQNEVEGEAVEGTDHEMVVSLSHEAMEHLWAIVITLVVFNCICIWCCHHRFEGDMKVYGDSLPSV